MKEMREILMLWTTEAPYTFNNKTYIQVFGVMMGSPLGPLFSNIMTHHVTIRLVKDGEEQCVLDQLNAYHP